MKMRVIPTPGLVIRNPDTHEKLPPEGIVVDRVTPYWRRRKLEGGVSLKAEPVKE